MHEDPVAKSKRITNSSGNVVSTIELDPWGGETNRSSNEAFQPRKFTTYERDSIGSDEAMHRRYNRWWARFEQPDPYDGSYDMTDPQSFNRYSYVLNDPVNFADPTGLVTYDGAPDPHLIADGLVGGLLWAIQHGGVLGYFHGVRVGDGYSYWSFSFFTQNPQNDCQTFATRVDEIARQTSTDTGFADMVYEAFKERNDRFAASGFRPEFADPTGESPNQVRHAAGAIYFAYQAGFASLLLPETAQPDALKRTLDLFNGRERTYSLSAPYGIPRRTLQPTTPGQWADIQLNAVAIPIGFHLGVGIIDRDDVGNLIRERICSPIP